jgi:O-antigen ligase
MNLPWATAKGLHSKGVSVAAFLLPALSLAVPSGYSWGALLLCMGAVGILFTARREGRPRGALVRYAVAVGLMGLLYATDALTAQGWHWNGLDRSTKFALALLALAAVVTSPVQPRALKWGIWVGALGAGATAAHQMLWQKLARAEGYTNAIQFGDIALLLGVWSWAWAYQDSGRTRWLGWLAGLAGFYACLVSESRGGWLMMPVLVALVVWQRRGMRQPGTVRTSRQAWWATLLAVAVTVGWQWPTLQHRTAKALEEMAQFQSGPGMGDEANTSVGQRLAHWQLAYRMGWERPLMGWGDDGYKQEKKRLIAQGEAPAVLAAFGHAHNDWLELWAKKGLLGVLALALLMGVPAAAYWCVLREPRPVPDPIDRSPRHAAALCGLVLVVGYAGFGQTQVMFAHNSGTVVYLFMNLLFLSACTRLPGLDTAASTRHSALHAAPPDHVTDAVTLCMTMGNRPELLDQTLGSLLALHTFKHVVAINDFGDEASNAVFRRHCPHGVLVETAPGNGHHKAIDLLYAQVTTPHIFHIEDDWHFATPIPFAAIFEALATHTRISQVCLRNLDDFTPGGFAPTAHKVDGGALPLFKLTALHDQWYGYTFNPHVTTTRLVKSLSPFSAHRKERHISRTLRHNGLYTAFLNPGGCTHLGDDHSVTAEVEGRHKGLAHRLRNALGLKA